MSWSPNLKKLLEQDDRILLKNILSSDLDSDLFKELIATVVRASADPYVVVQSLSAKQEQEILDYLEHKFQEWLSDSNYLEKLQKKWDKETSLNYSLVFYLSRAFERFKKEYLDKKSAQSLVAKCLGASSKEVVVITNALLEGHSLFVKKLPKNLRLTYQLHLDGLLNDEISWILNLPLKKVESDLRLAKSLLNEGLLRMGRAS